MTTALEKLRTRGRLSKDRQFSRWHEDCMENLLMQSGLNVRQELHEYLRPDGAIDGIQLARLEEEATTITPGPRAGEFTCNMGARPYGADTSS